ncbi:predicted protein [Sclerotinia sclerotiorum 1980 UF-70]|uniref:Uncharacterized protein n=1 Tax=Sclerotinia sclerotiorum (strain ATCC 18683 / 1980 / Ss-1) TaxID=665079 RepID=A7F558_SCLS1|nr:predicted protein [Sclerotinia sclerotiorum 1980 UF-70]EDN97879.1 predicted protein [Sclerotinia sclerotiorum 1980 UF-70]
MRVQGKVFKQGKSYLTYWMKQHVFFIATRLAHVVRQIIAAKSRASGRLHTIVHHTSGEVDAGLWLMC